MGETEDKKSSLSELLLENATTFFSLLKLDEDFKLSFHYGSKNFVLLSTCYQYLKEKTNPKCENLTKIWS